MENLGLLPFGNVSVVVITLLVAALAIALLLELGIWVVRLLIAADDENAPDIVIKNFVKDVIVKIWDLLVVVKTKREALKHKLVENYGGWLVISHLCSCREEYVDVHDKGESWGNKYNVKHKCVFSSKDQAEVALQTHYEDIEVPLGYCAKNLYKLLGSILAVDVTLLLLKVNFTLTVVALGIFGVGFSTRFIAKKLYKTMSRTTKNEDDIKDLQETVKVKGAE